MSDTVKSFKIFKNTIIKNNKGDIIKFLNKKDKFFKSFAEIYFSEIKKNKIKGWNFHKKITCTICVPYGEVIFSIYNDKVKKLTKIVIGKKNKKIIQIPPKNWFSFQSKTKISLIANLTNFVHSKKENIKKNIINGIRIK